MLYSFEDRIPKILGDNYFIAESADVIGSVTIHNNVIILSNAVVRADNEIIEIGENSNIQDGAVLHTDPGMPMQIGRNVTIAHNAMIHGRKVGDNSLIGIGAVVLSGAMIGNNCMVAAHALVLENQKIPDGSLVIGTGKIKMQLSDKQLEKMTFFSQHYLEKIQRFNMGLKFFDANKN